MGVKPFACVTPINYLFFQDILAEIKLIAANKEREIKQQCCGATLQTWTQIETDAGSPSLDVELSIKYTSNSTSNSKHFHILSAPTIHVRSWLQTADITAA